VAVACRSLRGVLFGYARAGAQLEVDCQAAALQGAGIPADAIYTDLATFRQARPRRDDLLTVVGEGDVIVVETLTPLGLTIRETLRLVRELAARQSGVRTLTGTVLLDTSDLKSTRTRRALAMFALVEDLDAAYVREREDVRRRRATAEGRRLGRPYADEAAAKYVQARQMRLDGVPVLTISRATGINPRTLTAYFQRHGIPVPSPGRLAVAPPTATDRSAD
jgi:DNA invertase Pin-like site-specific DNA recombinase